MKITSILLACSLAIIAQANPFLQEEVAIERSRAIHEIYTPLDASNVRCLVGDYGATSLKISLPELRQYTVFSHTTTGESEPCINAGFCKTQFTPDGLTPDMVIDPAQPMVTLQVTVVLNELLILNHILRTCDRSLLETVDSQVRGLPFHHQELKSLGKLSYDSCLEMKKEAK